jgi:hypothetical protein
MSERLAWRHGKYRLVAGPAGDGYVVRAYLGARLLHEDCGLALDGAVAEVRWWLDQHDRELRAQRRNGRPTVEEYRRALVLVPFGTDHEAMLRAHARAEGRTITAAELAAAVGHADGEAAAREYSRLGRRIAEFIGFTPPGLKQRGEPLWIAAIATPGRYDNGSWSWVLFPEMVEALMALEPV